MPISDEIIELEPVKKSRTKLIILFVIIGVLAAAAVAFLILYILKPSVEAGNGKVNQIEPEASALCMTSDAEGNKSLFAAVGNEYTVYARVSAEGDASTGVVWSMEPANSLIKVASGVDSEDPARCYYTFKPDDKFAGQHIVLTARSEADIDQVTTIEFDIKKQGAEVIELKRWWRGSSTTYHEIDGSALDLPYYNDARKNTTYTVSFEQLGALDAVSGKYIDNITKEEYADGVWSNKVDVTSSDSSVLAIASISENIATPRFTFNLKKSSDTPVTITITANAHNDFADPITKTITVNAKRSADMDIIEEIFFSTKPVDKAFYSAKITSPLNILRQDENLRTNEFTIPYNSKYDNLADHIVLYPLSIQYDTKTGELKDDWRKWIKNGDLEFTPSSNKINLSKANEVISVRALDVTDGSDCMITVADKSENSVEAKVDIKLRVIARTAGVASALRLPSAAEETDDTKQEEISEAWTKYLAEEEAGIDAKDRTAGFSVSRGSDTTFKVVYTVNAPTATSASAFFTNKYISGDFKFKFESKNLSIVKGGEYSTSNKDKIITSDNDYTLDSSFAEVKSTGQNKFTVTATFTVHVNERAEGTAAGTNQYTFEFTKEGISNASLSSGDPAWNTNVVLHIVDVADSAGFKYNAKAAWNGNSDEKNAWDTMHTELFGGSSAYSVGSYKILSAPTKGSDKIYRGSVSITVQNQSENTPFPFDFRELVAQHDTGPILVTVAFPSSASFTRTGTEGNHSIKFTGSNPDNFGALQQTITLTVHNIDGTKVAPVAVLTVDVYVVDPIIELSCKDSSVKNVEYSAGQPVSIKADEINYKTYRVDSPKTYDNTKIGRNVNLYFTGGGDPVELSYSDANSDYRSFKFNFGGDEVEIFRYTGSYLIQMVDFFEYRYNQYKNATFSSTSSSFIIEYCINASDTYTGEPAARRTITFTRKADSLGVYSDPDCKNLINSDALSDSPTKNIVYSMNTGASDAFYIAPIFNIKDKDSNSIVHFVAPNWKPNTHYTTHEDVYVTVKDVPTAFTVDNDASTVRDLGKGQYYAVAFTARDLEANEQEVSSVWSLVGGVGGNYKITVSIQNKTRDIGSITIEDASGHILDIKSSTENYKYLNFGRTTEGKNESLYSNTVKVKVTYPAITDGSTYNRFEPAIASFPIQSKKGCFYVSVDGGSVEVAGTSVTLEKTGADALSGINDQGAVTKEYTLVISCAKSSNSEVTATERIEAGDGQYVTVVPELTKNVKAQVGVKVSTGIMSVNYDVEKTNGVSIDQTSGATVAKNNTATYTRNRVTFALKTATDKPTLTLKLTGKTFGDDDDYSGLTYKFSKISKISGSATVNGGTSTNSGLSVSVSVVSDTVEITIEQGKAKTLDRVPVDIIFMGNSTLREIVIPLEISVTMDIFSLDIVGNSPDAKNILASNNTFATTGGSGYLTDGSGAKPQLTVKFNDNNANYIPTDAVRGKVKAELVVRTNGTNEYVATDDITVQKVGSANADIDITNNTVTLNILNSLLRAVDASGKQYYIRVVYTPIYLTADNLTTVAGTPVASEYKLIVFRTDAEGVRLKAAGNETITNGTASVDVLSASDTFNFVAEAYNLGTQDAVTTPSGNIIYKLYSDNTYASDKEITAGGTGYLAKVQNGVVTFHNPTARTGHVYLRITYTDGKGNVASPIDIDITYHIAIKEAKPTGKLASDNKITLYIDGNNNYTYINDIRHHFEITTNFDNVHIDSTDVGFTLESGATGVFSVNNVAYTVIPVAAGTNKTLTVTVDDGTSKSDKVITFTVNVIDLSAAAQNSLTLSGNAGAINIADETNTSVSLSASVKPYTELDSVYTVTSTSDRVHIAQTSGSKDATLSFDKSKFTSLAAYGAHPVSADVAYSVNSAYGDLYAMQGTLGVSKPYTLTANGEYTPQFKLKLGSKDITTQTAVDINGTSDNITVVVTNPLTGGGFTYSATSKSSVVNKVAGTNNEFEFAANKAGAVDITVTVTVYGKKYTSATQTYTFVYGGSASQSIQQSSGDGTYADLTSTTDPIYIDFDSATAASGKTVPTKFKYTISTGDIGGTIGEDDIKIDFTGNGVTASDISFNKTPAGSVTGASVEFTVTKATTLIISGSVRANGKTYYLAGYTLTLVAHDPLFSLNGTDTIALNTSKTAYGTTTLSVSQGASSFKGDYSVAYSIVGGGNYASVNATSGVVSVKPDLIITTDTVVTVRATVTVTSGVHAGATYTVDKLVTIKGVPLPEVVWKNSAVTVNSGTSVNLNNYTQLNGSVDGYTYSSGAYSFGYSIESHDGLTANTDYTLSEATLAITGNASSGGLITVRVTVTVTGAINKNATVRSGLMDIIINPTATVDNQSSVLSVYGGAGSHDLSSAITLSAKSGTQGHFVTEDDTFIIKSLSLASGALPTGIDLNGGKLNITAAQTTVSSLSLTAKVVINSGAYIGTTFDVPLSVTVYGAAITKNNTATWNTAGNEYNAITAKDLFTLPSADSGVGISSIKVSDNGFYSVTNNGGANPVICVNKDANITGGDALHTNGTLNVTLDVTLSNGHKYYVAGTISVNAVTPAAVIRYGNDVVLAENSTLEVESGASLEFTVAETNGLTVSDLGYVIVDGDDLLTAFVTSASNKVTFGAGKAGEDTTYAVEITFNVCGASFTRNFNITVKKADIQNAFTATNAEVTLLYSRTGTTSRTITSVWTPSAAMSDYMADPVSVKFSYSGKTADLILFEGVSVNRTNNATTSLTSVAKSKTSFNVSITVPLTTVRTFTFTLTYTGKAGNTSHYASVTYKINVARNITATFNLNGGTGSVSTQTVSSTSGKFTKPTDPTRAGYKFDGWFDSVTGATTAYNFSATPTQSAKLYAHWSSAAVTVSFDANATDVTLSDYESSKSVITGNEYGALPAPTRNGYSFDGWYTAESGGTQVTASTKVTATSAYTLYAHWSKLNSYSITFNANGGKFGSVDEYVKSNVEFESEFGVSGATVNAGATASRDNYSFDGWYDRPVGGSLVASTAKVTANTVVYAHWSADRYTVTLNGNGGTATPASITATYGSTYGDAGLPTTATRTGYTFAGWYTAASGGALVSGDTLVTEAASGRTLYAHWTANTYAVTISGGAIADFTAVYDSTYGACGLTEPTAAGKRFDGWYKTAAFDSGSKVEPADTVNITSAITLYPKWTDLTYTVTYNANGGKIGTADTQVVGSIAYNAAFSVNVTPTLTGYDFVGWFTHATGGVQLTATDKVTADMTVYAHWSAKTYKVTLDFGYGETEQIDVTYGETYGLLPMTVGGRAGYKFDGWYATSSFSGVPVTNITPVTAEEEHTLYAKWVVNSVVVIYYVDGALYNVQTLDFDADIALTPTKAHFEFDGWSTEHDNTGKIINKVPDAVFVSVYAIWTEITYKQVKLHVDPADKTHYVGHDFTQSSFEAYTPTVPTGYVFGGWYSDGQYENEVTELSADITDLYAKWNKTYTVTLLSNNESGTQSSITVTQGATYGDGGLPVTLSRAGYIFNGWHTATNGGALITGDTVVELTADQELYAHWTEIPSDEPPVETPDDNTQGGED